MLSEGSSVYGLILLAGNSLQYSTWN